MTTWDKTLYIRHPITKMYQFYKSDGNEELLMASNNQLHKQSGESFVSVGNLTSSKVKFLTYKDRFVKDVVLVADYGQLKKYDGNSVSSVIPYDPSVEEQTNPGLNDLNILTNFRTFAVKKIVFMQLRTPPLKIGCLFVSLTLLLVRQYMIIFRHHISLMLPLKIMTKSLS